MFQDRLAFSADSGTSGVRIVTWDGVDNDATTLAATGLGGVDLTDAGQSIAIRLIMKADQANGVATVRVYTDAANWSTHSIPIPVAGGGSPSVIELLRFADFTTGGGTGADFTNVGAIQLEIQGVDAVDGEIDDMGMIGPSLFTVDFANLEPLSLGDLVWDDTDNNGDNNGVFDGGETGIPNVDLSLYEDTDSSGDYTDGVDVFVASDTTDGSGNYRFQNLFPGEYIVRVDAANFQTGAALVQFASSTGNQPTPDPDDDVNNDDNGDALPDTSVVARAVTLTAGGESANDGDADPNTNLTVDFGFAEMADLIIVKLAQPEPVAAGDLLTYELTITNAGPTDATNVVATDTLPAGVTFVSATPSQGTNHTAGIVTADIGSLARGAQATVEIVVLVDPSATGELENSAVVTGDQFDPILSNNSTTVRSTLDREIDLAITKIATPVRGVAGQSLTYRLDVTNLGPSDASAVTVVDTLPAGVSYVAGSSSTSQGSLSATGQTITATLGDLAQGASAEIIIQVNIDPATRGEVFSPATERVLRNVATVSGHVDEPEADLTNNTATVDTPLDTLINLTLAKAVSQTTVMPGDPLTYTLTIENEGPSAATGVAVIDSLPAGVTFVSGSTGVSHAAGTVTIDVGTLGAGDATQATIVVDVVATTPGNITNTADVTGTEPERTMTDNHAEATVEVVDPRSDLAIRKLDTPDPVIAGRQLTYTLIVDNHGPSAATGVVVTDNLPDGVTFLSATTDFGGTVTHADGDLTTTVGNLPVGGTAVITIVVNVDPSTRGEITNIASVTGNEEETSTINNEARTPTLVNSLVDLVIFKADSPDPVVAGQQLKYTLSIINDGPSDATGVTVTDELPTGVTYDPSLSTIGRGTIGLVGNVVTANLGNLAAGETILAEIVVNVDPAARGELENTAVVTGNEPESETINNEDSVKTTINTMVDLSVTKQGPSTAVTAGSNLTYTVTVTNLGLSQATGVVLTDTLPPETTYVSATPSQGSASAASGVITVSLGNLAPGASATVTIVANIGVDTMDEITNRAAVTGTEPETRTDNNTALATTNVDALMSSIGGFVYVDLDNDGVKDTGESPIPGVGLQLIGVDATGATVNRQTTTGADGSYLFDDLIRGTYRVIETPPALYKDGRETAGVLTRNGATLAATPADITQNDQIREIQLPAGAVGTGFLFGEQVPVFSKRLFLSY